MRILRIMYTWPVEHCCDLDTRTVRTATFSALAKDPEHSQDKGEPGLGDGSGARPISMLFLCQLSVRNYPFVRAGTQ